MECRTSACAHPTARRTAPIAKDVVVLLHGSAGSSMLWKALRERLLPAYDVVTPDLIGYGDANKWPEGRGHSLDDEVGRIEGRIPCCEGDFHLVGYSYGGAVALALALSQPARIKSLTLVEPVLFSALEQAGEAEAFAALRHVQGKFAAGLTSGDVHRAMQGFIDFWTGDGAWSRMPEKHQEAALSMASKIRLDWEACFAFHPSPEELRTIALRTVLVRGDRSPQPMVRLVEALHRLMPGSELNVVCGANHLLPITHQAELAEVLIGTLLATQERGLR